MRTTKLWCTFVRRSSQTSPISLNLQPTESGTFEVESFKNPRIKYLVTTALADGPLPIITYCNCNYFKVRHEACKHIALVAIELPGYEFQDKPKPTATAQAVIDAAAEEEKQREQEPTEVPQVQPNHDVKYPYLSLFISERLW
ncbi:hypothetical protein BGX27_005793 [Mortierella sp. AM989]|nr:hypothetical protein BGX27_005793 [Mortierella sp. AM989]